MILYFSATGNSEYVAKQIASKTGDECFNLFDRIKNCDYSEIYSEKPLIFVCPTFAWQIPLFFRDWILATSFKNSNKAYFVLTCGAEAGGAGKYNRMICESKGLEYMGTAEVVLPDNYIYASKMATKEEALEQIEKSRDSLDKIIEMITNEGKFHEKFRILGPLKSGFINKTFNVFSKMVSKSFYADENCIGCGKCQSLCVMNNIKIENGRPVWAEKCSQCYACIHRCPTAAVQIKRHTEGKERYVFPERETNIN